MLTEQQPNLSENQGHGANGNRDLELQIRPKPVASLRETADQNREEFSELLRGADLRTLLRYVEDGFKIDEISEIPPAWKARFKTKEFRNQTFTWRNPKLYLLTRPVAAQMALTELLARFPGLSLHT